MAVEESSSQELQHPDTNAEWGWLPVNLLHIIFDKLVSFRDCVWFAAVSPRWRAVAAENKLYWQGKPQSCRPLRHRFPLLLVPDGDGDKESRNVYSVVDNAVYGVRIPTPKPFNTAKAFCGCSHGWLAFTHSLQENQSFPLVVTLLNPLSGVTIRLPEFNPEEILTVDLTDNGFLKLVLSADPDDAPAYFEAAGIYGTLRRVAHCRVSDRVRAYAPFDLLRVNPEDGSTCVELQPMCLDVAWYKGRFYAADYWGWVVALETVRDREWDTSESAYVTRLYLHWNTATKRTRRVDFSSNFVETSGGDLLLVRRYADRNEMRVFKVMDGRTGSKTVDSDGRAVEVSSVGDDALFIGGGQTFKGALVSMAAVAVPATEAGGWCKANSVYYAFTRMDVGMMRLEDRSQGHHYRQHYPAHVKGVFHPIWFLSPLFESTLLHY